MKKYSIETDMLVEKVLNQDTANTMRQIDFWIYGHLAQLAGVDNVIALIMVVAAGTLVGLGLNIGIFWGWVLVFLAVQIGGLYAESRKDKFEAKLEYESRELFALRKLCERATKFKIYINPNYKNWKNVIPKLNQDACTANIYNYIKLVKKPNGYLFSGIKPLYMTHNVSKKMELVLTEARGEFIANDTYKPMVFQFPTAKKLYNYEFDLSVSDTGRIDLDFSLTEEGENESIAIPLATEDIVSRILEAIKPYNDKYNKAIGYNPKKILFKYNRHNLDAVKKCWEERDTFLNSAKFLKLKYGSLEHIKNEILPGTRKYSHKYNTTRTSHSMIIGATHKFETESFIITIVQGGDDNSNDYDVSSAYFSAV